MAGSPMYQEIRLGDIVKMRKPHPCGGFEWEVVRLGADIGIRCGRCGRRVLIPRSQFLRQVKTLLQPGPDSSEGASPSSKEPPTL